MKRWVVLAGMVLALAACGGAGDEVGSNDDRAVIESSDGMASLTLSPASLPEGVSIDEVQLDVLVDETAEPGAPLLAVRMQPDGLVLSESAELTIALSEALEGGFMAIHMSGDLIEFLDGDIQQTTMGSRLAPRSGTSV